MKETLTEGKGMEFPKKEKGTLLCNRANLSTVSSNWRLDFAPEISRKLLRSEGNNSDTSNHSECSSNSRADVPQVTRRKECRQAIAQLPDSPLSLRT